MILQTLTVADTHGAGVIRAVRIRVTVEAFQKLLRANERRGSVFVAMTQSLLLRPEDRPG